MKVLVTGAGGFVGRHVCRALRDGGHEAVGAVRSRRNVGEAGTSALVEVGDVGALTDWRAALAGADAVVHLVSPSAEAIARGDEQRLCDDVIVEGTRTLVRQAVDAGVRRFVYMSSIKANGETTHGRPFDETSPPEPEGPYGQAKLTAEREAVAIARETETRVTVLRPPAVYGPGSHGNVYRLIRLIQRVPASLLPLGGLANRRSFIFVENLASAVLACVEDDEPVDRVFLLRDPEPVSTTRLAALILAALGRPAQLPPFPGPLAPLALNLAGRLGIVRRLYGDLDIDHRLIRAALHWTPPVDTADAIAHTVRWIETGEAAIDQVPPAIALRTEGQS